MGTVSTETATARLIKYIPAEIISGYVLLIGGAEAASNSPMQLPAAWTVFWLGVVLTTPKLVYVVALVAPLGFLSLLAPRAAAGALPGLAMTLLSTDPALFNYRSQYQAFVLPFRPEAPVVRIAAAS